MSSITGILLAAGKSTRFGSNKLLEPMNDQVTMVVQTARKLKEVLPESLAVVGPDDYQTADLLHREGFQIVINPHPENGMGSSLAMAIRASHDVAGWLIMLADMPWLEKQTIRKVVDALRNPRDIAAPLFGDRRGHPVGFGRAYVRELLALNGDSGAREIIRANTNNLRLINVQDSGVLRDVDYPQDLPNLAG